MRWRLLLSISAMIVGVIVVYLWVAYREVEATLVQASGDRAQNAAGQLARLFEQSAQQSVEELRLMAADPEVQGYLQEPTPGKRPAVIRRLSQRRSTAPRRVEVWAESGARLLDIELSTSRQDAPPTVPPGALSIPRTPGVRGFQVADGLVYSEWVAEIVSGAPTSNRLGFLIVRSTIALDPPGILNRLIGVDAAITLGNKTGDVWTDLSRVVPPPPVDLSGGGVREYETGNGEPGIGAIGDIRGTPWAVWVAFSRPAVVAPARTFRGRMLIVGVLVFLLAAGLVWSVSRRLTAPLETLTAAAEAIAEGDYTRRVPIERLDEVGRLGVAFNTMGAQIEDGCQHLQTQVRERTEALEALGASEAYYRAIVTVAFDCVITIDMRGMVTEFNPAAERTFGYQREDALGRELASLIVPPSLREAHRRGLARLAAGAEGTLLGKLVEMVGMRADGTEFPIELAIAAVHVQDAPMLTAVLRDITERKRAEQALLESERAYRSTFDEAPVGIAHLSLDGQGLRVNRRLGDLLGSADRPLMAVDLDSLAHPDDAGQDAAARETLLAGGMERYVGVKRYRRNDDGQFIWVNLAISLHRDAEGIPSYFIAIIEDLSERRRLEEQLRQAHKMEAVGRLAGGIAHDFNNLLTAILGYSDFVLEALTASHPARSHVEEIRRAGESASSLTRQLLAFSRQQVLQPQIVDLNDAVTQMDLLLRRVIGEDVVLTSRLATALDPVSVDPGQLQQIIMNLAVNARDAMPSGGQLRIETGHMTLDEAYVASHRGASLGPHVMLAVTDTGSGMSAETMSHVFEPFFTTKPRGEGTGLGLATTYGIVKQSGGSIWVDSEVGQGTTFKVFLPRATHVENFPAAPRPPARPAHGTETILVAEDQAEVRELTRMMLEKQGYTVLEAATGPDALRILRERTGTIDLLLTDVIMPAMSGRELVSHLHVSHPRTKVLYCSGYTDDAIVRHGRLEAGVAFLQKPFTSNSLLAKVREVLDGEVGAMTDTVRGG